MDGDSNEMDSLFEGMDFVVPLEDDSEFGVTTHNPGVKGLEQKDVAQHGSTLPATNIMPIPVSVPPVLSPALDPTSPLPVSGIGLPGRASTAIPSLPGTRSLSETVYAAPASPSSHGGLHRDQSEPLDESLFSGLIMSSVDDDNSSEPAVSGTSETQTNAASGSARKTSASSIEHVRSRSSDETSSRESTGNGDKDRASMDSIMSGYNDVSPSLSKIKSLSSGTPPISRANLNSPSSSSLSAKPVMRRKKRSVKIGYGREEEENEELALRKAAIREVVGASVARKDVLDTSSTSTPRTVLSRESSQGALYVEESAFGLGFRGDSEGLNGVEPMTEIMDAKETLASMTESDRLDVYGTTNIAAGGISDQASAQLVIEPDPRLIQANVESDSISDVQSYSSAVEIDNSELENAAEAISVSPDINDSNVIGGEVGGGVDGVQEEAELDVELLAQQREGTFEERLQYIKEAVAHKMEVLCQKCSAASSLRKVAVRRRRQAAEKVSSATSICKELEAELNAACEREDFEKADVLSGNIEEAEKNMVHATEAFRVAEAESDFAALKVQEYLDLQVDLQEKGARLFELLKQETEDHAENFIREVQKTASREMERLVEEEHATEVKRENLGIELRVINEASAKLKTAIEDLTKLESEERKALVERRKQVDVELQDLIALMRTKEAEIAEYDKRLMAVDEKMTSIVATFGKQQADLDAESENLASSALQLEKESDLISLARQGVEQSLADAEQEKLRLRKVAKLASEAGRAMKEAVDIKKAVSVTNMLSREKSMELVCKEKQAQSEAQLHRQDASSTRVLLQELTSMKLKLSQELDAVKERISFVEKKGPELDSEKKLAAAARNFKVAGRLAAEAKVLAVEKQEASADMARIATELEKVEGEAEIKRIAIADLENLLTMKEREAAMARCERLRLVAAAARDERDSAIELEDFDEAESLDSEAKTADTAAEELQRLYHLEGIEYEMHGNPDAGNHADIKAREAAMAECERLRLVAATARDERDAAVEVDHFEEAEKLDFKAETADAEADRLQRLYQLDCRQSEHHSNSAK